ncbi:Uncharacterized protein dnl_58540 [Desulfonema limicola]|uniref:Uncharacterized protein n=1 Tax=Desulfonema limicola TaxID=45656 RepID=A0A975BDN5_9BACT|nr:Uncharacterized protein dnl_58540 [Desulfonema limicola]
MLKKKQELQGYCTRQENNLSAVPAVLIGYFRYEDNMG